jgi:hypothetical protein
MFFDGKTRETRKVSAKIGNKRESNTRELVDNARKLREQRSQERIRNANATKIQAYARRYIACRRTSTDFRSAFDQKMTDVKKIQSVFALRKAHFTVPLQTTISLTNQISAFYGGPSDFHRLEFILGLLHDSLMQPSKDANLIVNALADDSTSSVRPTKWIHRIKKAAYLALDVIAVHVRKCHERERVDGSALSLWTKSVQILNVILGETRCDLITDLSKQDMRYAGIFQHIGCVICEETSTLLQCMIEHETACENRMMVVDLTEQSASIGASESELLMQDTKRTLLRSLSTALRVDEYQEESSSASACFSPSVTGQIHEGAWYSAAAHVLTIPALRKVQTLESFIQSLNLNDCLGWRKALSAVQQKIDSIPARKESCRGLISLKKENTVYRISRTLRSIDLRHEKTIMDDGAIETIFILSNFCDCVLLDPTTGDITPTGFKLFTASARSSPTSSSFSLQHRWMNIFSDVLKTLPLVSILRALASGVANSSSAALAKAIEDTDESNIPPDMVAGVRRLEYSISNRQRAIRDSEAASFQSILSGIAGIDSVLKIAADPVLLLSVLDDIEGGIRARTSSQMIVDGDEQSSVEIGTLSSLFDLGKTYTRILMSSPAGVDNLQSVAEVTSKSSALGEVRAKASSSALRTPVSISMLNSLAFARRDSPVTSRLWRFLIARFGVEVLFTALVTADEPFEALDSMYGSKYSKRAFSTFSTASTLRSSESLVGAMLNRPGTKSSASRKAPSTIGEHAQALDMDVKVLSSGLSSLFFLLCSVFTHQLSATDDREFFDNNNSLLTIDEICIMVGLLKRYLYRMYYTHPVDNTDRNCSVVDSQLKAIAGGGTEESEEAAGGLLHIVRLENQIIATKLYNALFMRCERRPYAGEELWQWKGVQLQAQDYEQMDVLPPHLDADDMSSLLSNPSMKLVLNCIPQVIPFEQRLKIFQMLLRIDRGTSSQSIFGGTRIEVRRDNIVEDAYDTLGPLPDDRLKKRIQVEFINQQGTREAGIDGGGLFKAFLDDFISTAFDPQYGLFMVTSDQLLCPDPTSLLVREDHLKYFHFIGRMLGMAMYHRILVEPQFSGVFLNVLLGRHNQTDDLWHLDKTVHNSLLALKRLASDASSAPLEEDPIEELGLAFDIEMHRMGQTLTRELLPNGSAIAVTKRNVHSYVNRYANFKLNVETAAQCRAFLSGFRQLIPVEWMRMFSPKEMQWLISGEQKPIDIADMRRHVNYGGGYADSQPYIEVRISHLVPRITHCMR